MKKTTIGLLLLSSIVFLSVVLVGASSTADPLPVDNALPGWLRSGTSKVFNQSELYGYIDGGAELFLEFGFERLTVQNYRQDGDELSLESYRMTDPEAAAGIYFMKCGREKRLAGFAEPHTAGRYQLMFFKDRFFFILNNPQGKEQLLSTMGAFARKVAAVLPATPPLKHFDMLPPTGLISGSARLIRGMYALQPIYTLGEGNILSLGSKVIAVAGSYREPGGQTCQLIVVNYPAVADGVKAFQYVRDHLDSYLKVQAKTDSSIVFQDYAGKYGLVILEGRKLTVKVNLDRKPR